MTIWAPLGQPWGIRMRRDGINIKKDAPWGGKLCLFIMPNLRFISLISGFHLSTDYEQEVRTAWGRNTLCSGLPFVALLLVVPLLPAISP